MDGAAAGPEIVFSLQMKGPWWTGNFGELWALNTVPVKPVWTLIVTGNLRTCLSSTTFQDVLF